MLCPAQAAADLLALWIFGWEAFDDPFDLLLFKRLVHPRRAVDTVPRIRRLSASDCPLEIFSHTYYDQPGTHPMSTHLHSLAMTFPDLLDRHWEDFCYLFIALLVACFMVSRNFKRDSR